MPSISVSVPGKTILFGEHAVVYGYPAIAAPLDAISLKITISARPMEKDIVIINKTRGEHFILGDLNSEHTYKTAINSIKNALTIKNLPAMQIDISSSIPIASGLGSSAAFAVGLTKSISTFLGFNLTKEKINEIAFLIETYQHGNPSGLDNTVIAFNKPVFYRKGFPPAFINPKKSLNLVIADTGLKANTKSSISAVKEKMEKSPGMIESIFEKIGNLTGNAHKLFVDGDLKALGGLMTENHAYLQELGVSCPELDQLVKTAIASGALGAKLCGSGQGGNIIALVDNLLFSESIKTELLKNGAARSFISIIKETPKEH